MNPQRTFSILLLALIMVGSTGCFTATSFESNQTEDLVLTNEKLDQPENTTREELNSLKMQVDLLEKAIAPDTPREAVEKWAEGFMTRNGALQFAIFSPELRNKLKPQWTWITGQSSPSVKSYQIKTEKQKSADDFEYVVRFMMVTSESEQVYPFQVSVKNFGEKWFITEFEPAPNS